MIERYVLTYKVIYSDDHEEICKSTFKDKADAKQHFVLLPVCFGMKLVYAKLVSLYDDFRWELTEDGRVITS